MACIDLRTWASSLTTRGSGLFICAFIAILLPSALTSTSSTTTALNGAIVARKPATTAEVESESRSFWPLEILKLEKWNNEYSSIDDWFSRKGLRHVGIKLFEREETMEKLAEWIEFAKYIHQRGYLLRVGYVLDKEFENDIYTLLKAITKMKKSPKKKRTLLAEDLENTLKTVWLKNKLSLIDLLIKMKEEDVLADLSSEAQAKEFAEIFPMEILRNYANSRYFSEAEEYLNIAKDFKFGDKKLSELMEGSHTFSSTMTEGKESVTRLSNNQETKQVKASTGSGKKRSWFRPKEEKNQKQTPNEALKPPVALEASPPPPTVPLSSTPINLSKRFESAPTEPPSNSLRARLYRFLAALWAKLRAILWPFD